MCDSDSDSPYYDSNADKEYLPSSSDSESGTNNVYLNGKRNIHKPLEILQMSDNIPSCSRTKSINAEFTNTNHKSAKNEKENLTAIPVPRVNQTQNEAINFDGDEVIQEETPSQRDKPRKTRKRSRNPQNWARNIRKSKYDHGEEYISSRKKLVPCRRMKTTKDCLTTCKYKCAAKITLDERRHIFEKYYTLSAEEKKLFIVSTTIKEKPSRGKLSSRRQATYKYFFNIQNNRLQVCKTMYLGTFSISQKPIYTAHLQNTFVQIPLKSNAGRHTKKQMSVEDKTLIIDHIDSFPRVDSHYCRASTNRQYLDSQLTIRRMYDLYVDKMQEMGKQPCKESAYRNVFVSNFNLYFHKPKKDRCGICEEFKLLQSESRSSETKADEYNKHIEEKKAMRENRNKDRNDEQAATLCFDLQNVLSCPKAEIGQFYYKTKLSVYNLTAHLSTTKRIYCAIWCEVMKGRKGNDIASALYRIILEVLKDNPNLKQLTLWSDSCVPQNRNSLISFAMGKLIHENRQLEKITMKYSTPGHSAVQEIDAVHSSIERFLAKTEYYSPVSLVRLLKQVNKRNSYRIIQMRPHYFLNFSDGASHFNYGLIPYTKVVVMQYTQCFQEVSYQCSYREEFKKVNIRKELRSSNTSTSTDLFLIKESNDKVTLPENKVSALKSMLPWMPEVDKQYYETILPKQNKTVGKNKTIRSKSSCGKP